MYIYVVHYMFLQFVNPLFHFLAALVGAQLHR